jgi:hypothetical protein
VATVPTPPTFENGVSDTTELNLVRDSIRFLLEPPRAQLRQTTLQTLTTAVAAAIQFQTEDFDSDVDGVGGHDNAVNNSRYIARYPGRYLFSGGGVGFAANATGRRATWWKVNGADVSGSAVVGTATATLECAVAARGISVYLNVGDYVELVGYQESGGNLNTTVAAGIYHSSVTALWIGLT